MKPNQLITASLTLVCALFLQSGCDEQAAAPQQLSSNWFQQFQPPAQSTTATATARTSPRIIFENKVHDFGVVSPETSSLYEFKFKNTGNGILKIGDIAKDCGCTTFALDKTDYAPGEIGALRVKYLASTQLGPVTRQLVVSTNDPTHPEVALTLKAAITAKVDYQPKTLSLVLNQQNAGCPAITITSTDNQPFSITNFTSTGNFITADFDPSKKATSFVLHPKVNMAALENTSVGLIDIGLTHPECKKITLSVSTLPRFRISPPTIMVRGVEANKPIIKQVRIQSNYDEHFDLEAASSQNGTVRILRNSVIPNGYELELEITPPANRTKFFSEAFSVKVKGGPRMEIPCRVFYSGAPAPRPTVTTGSKKCPVCGPRIIDPRTGTVTWHPTGGESGS
jgi:Protein of unknown function (DUF1573)